MADTKNTDGYTGQDRPILFAIFGLNRAGQILWGLIFVVGIAIFFDRRSWRNRRSPIRTKRSFAPHGTAIAPASNARSRAERGRPSLPRSQDGALQGRGLRPRRRGETPAGKQRQSQQ
jgi:hypothetical protein